MPTNLSLPQAVTKRLAFWSHRIFTGMNSAGFGFATFWPIPHRIAVLWAARNFLLHGLALPAI
jgi:hypothetical protein